MRIYGLPPVLVVEDLVAGRNFDSLAMGRTTLGRALRGRIKLE